MIIIKLFTWLPVLEANFKILAGILESSPSGNFVVNITSRWQQFPCYKNAVRG